MRLDKYLKDSRLIKRREVANVLISEGSILVNNKKSKPGYIVKSGDFITLNLGLRHIEIKVIVNEIKSNKKSEDKFFDILKDEIIRK